MAKSRRRDAGCCRSNRGDTTTTLPILPQDVILEILSWLPAKHLWGFRFVSKSWFKSLTVDPQFAKLHSDRSLTGVQTNKAPPSILALQLKPPNLRKQRSNLYLATEYASCHKATHLKLPFHQDSDDYKIYGTCNGLVCLSSAAKHEVYIWNPLTDDHIVIPYPYLYSYYFEGMDMFTLGFNQGSNEYKLVRISPEVTQELSVYTLGIGSSWRSVELYAPVFTLVRTQTQLVNGVLHWIVARPDSPFNGMVVGLDLRDEVLWHVPTPDEANLDDLYCRNYFLELDGLLCLCTQDDGEPIQIWVMKEYGVVDSWVKQFIIGTSEICQSVSRVKPLAVYNGEFIIMMKTHLILYNPETNSTRKIKGFKFELGDVYAYAGSIVSPTVISGGIGGLQHVMK